jgi:hypothetical protein
MISRHNIQDLLRLNTATTKKHYPMLNSFFSLSQFCTENPATVAAMAMMCDSITHFI